MYTGFNKNCLTVIHTVRVHQDNTNYKNNKTQHPYFPTVRQNPCGKNTKKGSTCLFFDIFKGGGGHDRETDEEDVCLRITQRS